jgi:hypothetical protein
MTVSICNILTAKQIIFQNVIIGLYLAYMI